jgi:hypothetical protein
MMAKEQAKVLGVKGAMFLEDKERCSTGSVKPRQNESDVMVIKPHLQYEDSPGFEWGGKRKFL